MDAIIRFLQDTGFYLFSQDGNWRCLIMLGIACVLLYLGIVKKFEPLLLVPIAFGMLITNLPGANMFHEIFFAGGHIHWDLIGGQPVTASLLADLHSQGVAENVLAPYIQQLMTAAQTAFSPEMVEQAIAAVTEEAGAAITALEAQLQALVQAEQAAAYYGMTLSDITITPGLVDILYLGVKLGIYPCLIFMGVGAMTDFGPLIANPKSLLLGAAAQLGIFITFVGCRFMGFTGPESSAIGIIGGADGPTAIFVTVLLAPALLGPIAVAAYSYMALVPVIQPPIMKLLTTEKERQIVMKPLREVSKKEKIIFPIVVTIFVALLGPIAVAAYSYMALVPVIQPPIMKLLTTEKERQIVMKPLREVSKKEKIIFPIVVTIFVALLVPSAAPLIACLMLGNLFKECGVTERLSKTVQNELINIVTIFLGVSVGATATGTTFLSLQTIKIMAMGVVAFSFGTAGGVLLAKFMNLFLKEKINPLIGSAGVSAVPMAARVSQMVGQKYNPGNFLLMHAMGPNVAGVIGSAIAAGVLISLYG